MKIRIIDFISLATNTLFAHWLQEAGRWSRVAMTAVSEFGTSSREPVNGF